MGFKKQLLMVSILFAVASFFGIRKTKTDDKMNIRQGGGGHGNSGKSTNRIERDKKKKKKKARRRMVNASRRNNR